jgi:hypothetical protein
MHNLYLRLRALMRRVDSGESSIDLLSTGERLAVSLVLDQIERLHEQGHTALSAVDRIGTEWTQAAIAVQRDGWKRRMSVTEVSYG